METRSFLETILHLYSYTIYGQAYWKTGIEFTSSCITLLYVLIAYYITTFVQMYHQIYTRDDDQETNT